jgi:hypothetical protein
MPSPAPTHELVRKGRYVTIFGQAGDSEIVKRSRDDIARFLGWDICSRLGEVPDAGGLRTPLDTGSSHRFPVRFQLQNETGLTFKFDACTSVEV